MPKKRERLQSRHFLFMHVSTSKISAQQKNKLRRSGFASLMYINSKKGAPAKQAFPFQACFNEQNFCAAEK